VSEDISFASLSRTSRTTTTATAILLAFCVSMLWAVAATPGQAQEAQSPVSQSPVSQTPATQSLATQIPDDAIPEAQAADVLPSAIQRRRLVTPQEREQLQRTLDRNAPVVEALAETVKAVARLTMPAVVHIETDVTSHYSHVEEAGSGVIINVNGTFYALTNRHVVQNAEMSEININLADERRIHPVKVWVDAGTDVAVMQIETSDLVAAPIGNSDKMAIGDFVMALGSPFGLNHSGTLGIISAKGRRNLELGHSSVLFQDFIQTDAAINPGNSGGPLVNLRGEVIGINTAIASSSGGNEGIGFAIPINMVMLVSRQLIERGQVVRAFLGVTLDQNFGPAMAAEVGLPCPVGARITSLIKGAAAAEADLKVGDVILRYNDIPVEDDAHLMNLVSMTAVGTTTSLVVFRDRKPITLQVVVGKRAKLEPTEKR